MKSAKNIPQGHDGYNDAADFGYTLNTSEIIINVSAVNMHPIRAGEILKASSNAAQIVLLCTELKANPKVK